MPNEILPHDEIRKLRAAIISAGLSTNRRSLLTGIDAAFVAGLPNEGPPGTLILDDLSALNAAGALEDGTIPLAVWLGNAVELAGPRKEAKVFRRALEQLGDPAQAPRPQDASPAKQADGNDGGSQFSIHISGSTVGAIAVGPQAKAKGNVTQAEANAEVPVAVPLGAAPLPPVAKDPIAVASLATVKSTAASPADAGKAGTKVPVQALIMKGGGVKGLALAGAIVELEKYYTFSTYVGTSAGAIAAVLLAAGYPASELQQELQKLNFRDFLDSSRGRGVLNLLFNGGLNTGVPIVDWIANKLQTQISYTNSLPLERLPRRAIVYAALKGDGELVFDSRGENKSLDASFAVRCSMSIPVFFAPQEHGGRRVYDGGLLNNFPVEVYLRRGGSPDFIALYLGSDKVPSRKRDWQLMEVLDILLNRNEPAMVDQYRHQTIVIDTAPVGTVDFDLSDQEKEFLVLQGRAAALDFLAARKLPNGPDPVAVSRTAREAESAKHAVQRVRFFRALRRGVLTFLVVALLVGGFWAVSASGKGVVGTLMLVTKLFESRPPPPLCPADMVGVPTGAFEMGSTDGFSDERPVRNVTLSAYCIDRTEVTVNAYAECVAKGGCGRPDAGGSCNWERSEHGLHPINCLGWALADKYCRSVGKLLATEAQWEYAARGGDGRKYPWGNDTPNAELLNACDAECKRVNPKLVTMFDAIDNWPETAPVGSYPKGQSPFGALDMAGNVWEWVADPYAPYDDSTTKDPIAQQQPGTHDRTIRGGGWVLHDRDRVRAANRRSLPADMADSDVGFRCARAP